MSTQATAPPGWPSEVPPPDAPDWVKAAVNWLYDLCPPDYRAHEVLRRYPVVLARFAARHVASAVDAARDGLANARAELGDVVDAEVVDAAIAAYEREGRRLASAARAVALVEEALRGKRFVPRL